MREEMLRDAFIFALKSHKDMCYKDDVSLMPMWNELDRLIKGK